MLTSPQLLHSEISMTLHTPATLVTNDAAVFDAVRAELHRQQDQIELIAS
jgi:hypothetical protein